MVDANMVRVLEALKLRVEPEEFVAQDAPDREPHRDPSGELAAVLGRVKAPTAEASTQLFRRKTLDLRGAMEDRLRGVDRNALYLLDTLSRKSETELRNTGVNFVTAAGQASVSLPGIHIDVRLKNSPRQHARTNVPSRRSENLFSTRRAQLICCLLTWPDLLRLSHRDIAQVSGISIGMVPETLALLRLAGFADRSGGTDRLRSTEALIDLWTAAYPTGLLKKLTIAEYAGDIPPRAKLDVLLPDAVVVGETALSDIRNPQTLTVFVDDWNIRTAIQREWRKSEKPNIAVRKKFWADARGAYPKTTHLAPPLLMYAELNATGDPRLIDSAEAIRRENPQLRAD